MYDWLIIVFAVNGGAKLIDFDLVAEVGEDYPPGYNDNFEERHSEAKECEPRMIVHDRHSLICLLTANVSLRC